MTCGAKPDLLGENVSTTAPSTTTAMTALPVEGSRAMTRISSICSLGVKFWVAVALVVAPEFQRIMDTPSVPVKRANWELDSLIDSPWNVATRAANAAPPTISPATSARHSIDSNLRMSIRSSPYGLAGYCLKRESAGSFAPQVELDTTASAVGEGCTE